LAGEPFFGAVEAKGVTWVPPSALWLEGVGKLFGPKNLKIKYTSEFQSELGVKSCIGRISATSEYLLVLVKWNVTWVPPSALWLEGVGKLFGPKNLKIKYTSYNHLSGTPTAFSWKAVGKLFVDAITTGVLRVPLACIEGTTELQFSRAKLNITDEIDNNNEGPDVVRISEELAYAQDLKRGALQNRKCAQDLRLFLETGRRMCNNPQEWDDKVARSLPWESVPGSNVMDVDPVEEGPVAAVLFIGFAALCILLFASVMGPELIGQSLFGPPSYIVRPEDLNSIY
jgi:hypothetical protein